MFQIFKGRFLPKNIEISFKCRYLSSTSAVLQKESVESETGVLVEKDANITLVGINRENTRNSINSSTAQKLCEALHQFESDDSSPVAVLYGVGGSFCAGYDIKELEEQIEQNNLKFLLNREGSVGPTRQNSHLQKPIICAINGFCVASGLELALICDLRVMEDTAVLGFFNRHLGMPISDGGTMRLAASVGYSYALDLIATGRRVTGDEALQMGLINRLVATGTALGQAVNLAHSIEKLPMASLQHDRKALFFSRVYGKKYNLRDLVQNEIMSISPAVLDEIQDGCKRFKNSEFKGASSHSWYIEEKSLPDWEKEEIAHEKEYALRKLKCHGK